MRFQYIRDHFEHAYTRQNRLPGEVAFENAMTCMKPYGNLQEAIFILLGFYGIEIRDWQWLKFFSG